MKNSVSRKKGHWILCTPAAREERARPWLVARPKAFSEGRRSGYLTQNQDGRVRYWEGRARHISYLPSLRLALWTIMSDLGVKETIE